MVYLVGLLFCGMTSTRCKFWRAIRTTFILSFINKELKLFEIFFIYGNPTFTQRQHSWRKVKELPTSKDMPWVCVGDFNDMTAQSEKEGIRAIKDRRLSLFKKFISDSALMDLELKGCKFTWVSNPRDGVVTKETLDRILVHWEWRQLFPNAIAVALPMVNSDHSPIVLVPAPMDTSGRRFNIEAMWQDHPEFGAFLADSWTTGLQGNTGWHGLSDCVQKSSRDMVVWHKQTFKNAKKEIERLSVKLQSLLNTDQYQVLWDNVNVLRKQIDDLWKQEEQFWGAKT